MAVWLVWSAAAAQPARAQFVHPGGLHTQADFDRMAAKVAAGADPWSTTYQKLLADPHAQLTWTAAPVGVLCRTGNTAICRNNYTRSQEDAQAIYDLTLRYRVSGDAAYADKAVAIMDAWSSTLTGINGDTNAALCAGICGYLFAIAGEALRGYDGWSAESQSAYATMLVDVIYPVNHDFLSRHNNTCDSHYRCNWDTSNMAAMIGIGVFADRQDIFDEAVTYFKDGIGNGNIHKAVAFIHAGGLGQTEESGRDQAHNMGGFDSLGMMLEIAWNQGVDLYGYENNLFLRGLEYIAKYNLLNDVPYVHYRTCDERSDEAVVSPAGRGNVNPQAWERGFNHYVNRLGLAAPNVGSLAAQLRPDGPPNNYGTHPSRFDWIGLGSLTFYLDPIESGAPPSGLLSSVAGQTASLSWWGSAYATSYNIKRATTSGGPYATVATTDGADNTSYIDAGLEVGTIYYYVVSANTPDGESDDSDELAVEANLLLTGTVIGSPGSFNDSGATIENVFDGYLGNFYDAADASGDWAGLDLGRAVRIGQVSYAPRRGFADRMVGGQIQGSNVADFSSVVVTLLTIDAAPPDDVLTSQSIANAGAYRYVRYIGPPSGFSNVAEVQFYASSPARGRSRRGHRHGEPSHTP